MLPEHGPFLGTLLHRLEATVWAKRMAARLLVICTGFAPPGGMGGGRGMPGAIGKTSITPHGLDFLGWSALAGFQTADDSSVGGLPAKPSTA